jgi:hypothetical protein
MVHREAALSAKPLQEKCFHDKESATSLLETKNQPASYRELLGISLLGFSVNKAYPRPAGPGPVDSIPAPRRGLLPLFTDLLEYVDTLGFSEITAGYTH